MTEQRRRIHVAYMEGMAALGLIKRFWAEDCDAPGMRRIIAEDVNGVQYETKCIDSRGAKKVILYLANGSRYSRDLVLTGEFDEFEEEVFEGEEDEG
ncbi:hypothetical protein [Pyrodictium occultum]|nr:hypothetical protein [Pyrodictium occultum]